MQKRQQRSGEEIFWNAWRRYGHLQKWGMSRYWSEIVFFSTWAAYRAGGEVVILGLGHANYDGTSGSPHCPNKLGIPSGNKPVREKDWLEIMKEEWLWSMKTTDF